MIKSSLLKGRMAKLEYAYALGAYGVKPVEVRVLFRPQNIGDSRKWLSKNNLLYNTQMNQKGLANIALVFLAAVLVGAAGYFALNNRTLTPAPTPPIDEQPTPTPPQPTKNNAPIPSKPTPNNNPPVTNETPTNWQFIDANSFTLSLPPGWNFNKLQGFDSYVGEFVGDGAKLSFDYGWYSDSLAEDNDPKHSVTYETIGSYRAKIVVPKVMGNGTTGVYFDDLGDKIQKTKFNISGQSLNESQQETALKIFRTLKFKK